MPEENALQQQVRRIISDAGGELIGRIRLQKIAFLMTEAGFLHDFSFEYYHYGPYSEALEVAVKQACADKVISEEEKATEWGTPYYIYRPGEKAAPAAEVEEEKYFVTRAKSFPSVVLELAATTLYLYRHEEFYRGDKGNPWLETERRKKFKAREGRLRKAYEAYEALRLLPAQETLPEIAFPF
ncbi:MAG: hypothetical protein DU429_03955 [Candidatus Tokpelaia sp.]|uniref:hypothetical protein n=1 Tax=Candidatus Tokpelaia sp. TaxID=2233777 RepID=UPI0012387DB9|nr:hypothetical protein [Candidatus Tokpelaia sp.]KAA6205006.1 MAG: hypothetical protein DU430_06420 [Candidatus Tokpelaia sp.]KAA6207012.1 MAG: hypothetical protein DU429_03955 [Candidatus Tokpelaia sp.]KAA6405451.1 hypothetical protein DPQ22_05200 [Candidatus Tokpelaia sp.]